MPVQHELIEQSDDPEERALFERVGRKMGLGGRGALVAGTGMQALQALESLASQPGFWSDGSDDEGGYADLQPATRETTGLADG